MSESENDVEAEPAKAAAEPEPAAEPAAEPAKSAKRMCTNGLFCQSCHQYTVSCSCGHGTTHSQKRPHIVVLGATRIVVDPWTGDIYVLTQSTVEKVEPGLRRASEAIPAERCGCAGFGPAWDACVDPLDGTMYMSFPDSRVVVKIGEDGRLVQVLNGIILYGGMFPDCFFKPTCLAFDKACNLYVTDASNNKIYMVTPEGVATPLAGSGLEGDRDGGWIEPPVSHPTGVAVDEEGNVYVTDRNDPIKKFTPEGVVTKLVATGEYSGVRGRVHVDCNGNVYFISKSQTIQVIMTDGTLVTLAKTGDMIDGGRLGPLKDFAIQQRSVIVVLDGGERIVPVRDPTIGAPAMMPLRPLEKVAR
jgi:hypothetical protein